MVPHSLDGVCVEMVACIAYQLYSSKICLKFNKFVDKFSLFVSPDTKSAVQCVVCACYYSRHESQWLLVSRKIRERKRS